MAINTVPTPTAPEKLSPHDELIEKMSRDYRRVRGFSERLAEPLETEDYVVQSMPDVSPTKWHLAHVSWFFETFVLAKADPSYQSPNPRYTYLFNSYYQAVGPRHCRPLRGLISRPTVAQTYEYRRFVDESMIRFIEESDEATLREWAPVITLGLHHEQQHQELLLTDIKHVFAQNPLAPVYRERRIRETPAPPELEWITFPEGVFTLGHEGGGFCYDNETPRHRQFLEPYQLATRLITNAEYLEFIEDHGYGRADLWLSDGWATAQQQEWSAPLYWRREGDRWMEMTLQGLRPLEPHEPVAHVSLYEADAFARWRGARLPTEAEWESASVECPVSGNFAEDERFHPVALECEQETCGLQQMFGDVWEWTGSAYRPYPGYQPPPGAIGEYNGKFMNNQYVLRGGSCATSVTHIRPTYRNFFPPDARWQFTGIRLARDAR